MAAMAKQPTIHDVAHAAGVSVTTVSDALNGKGRVGPATRMRVEAAGRSLGYQANRHARGLRSGRSGAVGLLLPVGADARSDEALKLDFYMRLASAAAATTFSHKQALMLLPPTVALSGLRSFALDGGIVVDPSERDVRTGMFQRLGLPVVTIERDLGGRMSVSSCLRHGGQHRATPHPPRRPGRAADRAGAPAATGAGQPRR